MPEYFEPTKFSRAARHVPMRSKGHFTGALVTYFNNERRIVVFESRLELRVAYLWATRADVVDFIDQAPAISFEDANGKTRHHFLDFIAVMRDGRKIGIAVKPADRARRYNLADKLGRVLASANGAVDEIRLVTERSFTLASADNAELLHFIASEADDDADHVVRQLVNRIHGKSTIESVVKASGLDGRAFRSIVRLIARREITQSCRGRLSDVSTTTIAKAA